MKVKSLILFGLLLVGINVCAQQEKRLALVIGNANYDKGALDNPVNDALLMEKTLKSLDFDVILDTNIATLQDFNLTVRKFGDKRDEYNVGFIYYAGHGVQINGENYLLATKEKYASEYDVDDNALSVQKIMRYLTNKTNQVNVLILDACRDNPFEQNWNPQARSSDGGRGLAKIPPPTGSLIAFSTDAGNTAADGEGKNSIYCLSLAKNMQLENTTLDQVFRNVRTDVLKASNNTQRPVEASQLTGEAFYLKKGTYTDELIFIDSLIEEQQYIKGLEIVSSILNEDENNKFALIRKARLYGFLDRIKEARMDFNRVNELYPNDATILLYRGKFYNTIDKFEEALDDLNKAIELDPNNPEIFKYRGHVFFNLEKFDEGIKDMTTAIEKDSLNIERYLDRARFFEDIEKLNEALQDYNTAISLEPENKHCWYKRGRFYSLYGENNDAAIKDLKKAIEIDSSYVAAISELGNTYYFIGNDTLALKWLEMAMKFEDKDKFEVAWCYSSRADIYFDQEKLKLATDDYSKAIALDPNNSLWYTYRARLYEYLEEENNAFLDYSKAIELEPEIAENWYNRGDFHYNYGNDLEALNDLEEAVKINPSYVDAINTIGIIYEEQGKLELAIETYERGIALEETAPLSAAYCYRNRAAIYKAQEKFDLALADYTKAIELEPENALRWNLRAALYEYLEEENKAFLDYSKAIELEPENAENWYNRGVFHYNYGNDNEALNDLEKALKIDSLHVNAIIIMGIIFKMQEKIELAIKTYELGIFLEKTDPSSAAFCYNNRANIYRTQEKFDLAIDDYTKAIELVRDNSLWYLNRAKLYQEIGQENNAFRDFSKAIELEPEIAENWYNRGDFHYNFGHDKDALNDLKEALKVDSTYVDAINLMGLIYQNQEKIELAIKTYDHGIAFEEIAPESVAYCYSNRAAIHKTQEKFQLAIDDYTKAIALDSINSLWYTYRARLYEYLEEENKAFLDYSKAIELEPEIAENWYNRGDFHYNYGNDLEALNDLEEAVKINPSYVDAINTIGIIYEEQGKLELAIETYERGIALEETAPESAAYCYSNRAAIYETQEKFDLALSDYSKAIELEPENALRWSFRASFYENLGEQNNAFLDYSRAIELEPENAKNWFYRGNFHYDYEHYTEALNDFEEAVKINPSYVDAINTIGVIYEEQGNIELAFESYERCIDLEETDPLSVAYCFNNRAVIYETQEKFDFALADYSKAIKLDPENPFWYIDRAIFYESQNEENKAFLDYSKAIDLDPGNTDFWIERAKFFMNIENFNSANKDYLSALKIEKDDPRMIANYALFLTRNNEFKKAHNYFDKAMKIDKDETMIYFNRAKAYKLIGFPDKAIDEYKTVIKIDPDDPEGYYYIADYHEASSNYIKAVVYLSKAIERLGGEKGYYVSDSLGKEQAQSKIYLRRAKLFRKLEESEFACEDYQKALELLKDEPFYMKKEEDQNALEEKIKNLCN